MTLCGREDGVREGEGERRERGGGGMREETGRLN